MKVLKREVEEAKHGAWSLPLLVISGGSDAGSGSQMHVTGYWQFIMWPRTKEVDGYHLFSTHLPYLNHVIKFSRVYERISTVSIL